MNWGCSSLASKFFVSRKQKAPEVRLELTTYRLTAYRLRHPGTYGHRVRESILGRDLVRAGRTPQNAFLPNRKFGRVVKARLERGTGSNPVACKLFFAKNKN